MMRDGTEWHQLGVGRHLCHQAGGLDASQVDEHDNPDRAEGEENDYRPPPHHREEVDDRAGKGDGDDRQRRPDRYPVAPRDEKAGKVAVGQAGVGVGPAGCRRQARQPGEGQAKTDRPCAHDDPDKDGEVAIGSDGSRRQIEARPDHVADHDGRARRHPEALAVVGCSHGICDRARAPGGWSSIAGFHRATVRAESARNRRFARIVSARSDLQSPCR